MNQRHKFEQLCRYITRPAIAHDRLSINHNADVVLRLKTPDKDGTTHIVMTPLEFMQRLAALVPRPRLNLMRFHAVLAPNAKLRSSIIPGIRKTVKDIPDHSGNGAQRSHSSRISWAQLLKRGFDIIDGSRCSHRGGQLKIIAAIQSPPVIARILGHLGLPTRAPPKAPQHSFDQFATA